MRKTTLMLSAALALALAGSAQAGSPLVTETANSLARGDCEVEAAETRGRDRPGVSAGIGFAFGRGFSVNTTLAWQFDEPRVRGVTLGAKLEF